jgi:uridine kinase
VLQRIFENVGEERIAVLDHDAYYRDLSHLPLENRIGYNFDHPDALETALMRAHLDQLIAGSPIEKPVYDFKSYTRSDKTQTVEPRPVIIVEGILVLAEKLLLEKMDIKIYVDTADDIRLLRRIRRDIHERGRSIDSVLAQYERTVRPMHIEFVEPSKRKADLIIPHGGHNMVAIDLLLARIDVLVRYGEDAMETEAASS